jgi:hypothetical protein
MEDITIYRLGQIELTTRAIVSDPYFDRDRGKGKYIRVKPGAYRVFIVGRHWHNQVAMLIIAHESLSDIANLHWETLSDEISVESGQCGIFDDAIYPCLKDGVEYACEFFDEVRSFAPNVGGILWNEKGVVSSPNEGSGYTLYGYGSKKGAMRYTALAINFNLRNAFELIKQIANIW